MWADDDYDWGTMRSIPSEKTAVLNIPENLWTELRQFVYASKVEIGGFIIGRLDKGGKYTATRIHLVRQVVHGSEVDVETMDIVKLANELAKKVETDFKDFLRDNPAYKDDAVTCAQIYHQMLRDSDQIIGQWHSHVQMGCFKSPQDRDTLAALATEYGNMIMLIMSKVGSQTEWEAENYASLGVKYDMWISQQYPLNISEVPIDIYLAPKTAEPLSRFETLKLVKDKLFSSDKYRVETKDGENKGKIVERTKENVIDINAFTRRTIRQSTKNDFGGCPKISYGDDSYNNYWSGGHWR